ncbi:S-adenosylmethionine sensor upstream of mTORC1 (Probable methyltransferase BMT2 homolog) [Durusdinium trenchii]|uniref:S-adenosylmethionine sensor upstream of mTORC1 (Probable methyltransferase BMT2 homolog) n=1 Tax=Durusdinium trenchii TaxID=1381693 RepID=A0ABP0L234_9DINO
MSDAWPPRLRSFFQARLSELHITDVHPYLSALEQVAQEELIAEGLRAEATSTSECGEVERCSHRRAGQRLRELGLLWLDALRNPRPAAEEGPSPEQLRQLRARQRCTKEAFEAQERIHRALRERGELRLTEDELEMYSNCAKVVGSKSWSQATVQWVLDELDETGAGEDARLLDVGSSYGAFLSYLKKSVALDLAPAIPGVWRGDFLQLEIKEREGFEGEDYEVDEHGELQSLRAGAFDAVVLSLVLSFLPTPQLRRAMLDRARRCLREDPPGSLFVIEKTSLIPRDVQEGRLARQAFQEALEAAGFQSQTFLSLGQLDGEQRPHAHAWHLRTAPARSSSPLPHFKEDASASRDDCAGSEIPAGSRNKRRFWCVWALGSRHPEECVTPLRDHKNRAWDAPV